MPGPPPPAHAAVTAPLEGPLLGPARDRLLAGARGRVLEVGAGAGANLARYPRAVDRLDLCEPDPGRRRRLERRVASRPWPFEVAVHPATAAGPFPAAPYDMIVSTLVMCTVPDPQATAAALRGALAEGGRVAYLEHVHGGGLPGRLQARLSAAWQRLPGGCHLDRPATAALRAAGLVPVEQQWIRLPPPLLLAIVGQAVVRSRPTDAAPPPGPAATAATVPV